MARDGSDPLAFLIWTPCPGLSQQVPPAPDFGEIRAQIEGILLEHDIPSMAVAVSIGGEVLWEEGFGWADREARRLHLEIGGRLTRR